MFPDKSNKKVKLVESIDLTVEEETSNITSRLRRTPKPTKGQAHARLLANRLKAPSLVNKKKTKPMSKASI